MSRISHAAQIDRAVHGVSAFSIIYVPLILLLLVAFVAMAVDTGRIRLAKAQLQGAADAAARAGARSLPLTGDAGAPSITIDACGVRAQNVAQANVIAETNVQMTPATDIHWGTWDASASPPFTELFGDARYSANACRVVALASAARGTAVPLWITPHVTTFDRKSKSSKLSVVSNLQAEAIAYVTRGPHAFGFISMSTISGNGTTHFNASIAADGDIDVGKNGVNGDARAGIGHTFSGTATGWTANLDYLLAPLYPIITAAPGGLPGVPTNKILIGGPITDPNKYYGDGNGVTISSGYVIIYQNVNLNLGGVTFQNPTTKDPARIEYRMVGNSVTVGSGTGNNQMYCHLYAPQCDLSIKGTEDFYGWAVAKSIRLVGTSSVNYDGLAPVVDNYKVQLVK